MIPNLQIPPIPLFGLQIYPFGILVATGIYLGTLLAARRARQTGLDERVMYDAGLISVLVGFFVSHFVHLAAYHPDELLEAPWKIFQFWAGISSYGGFLGAGVAIWFYARWKKLQFLPYADALMFGLTVGWFFGRVGCFTAHDHLGRKTNFFLAVKFPAGARHDLGLYEAIFTLGLIIFVYTWGKRQSAKPGKVFAAVCALYAPARFLFDSLRATDFVGTDARYFGLTPAQYGSILLFGFSIALWRRVR